MRIQFTKEAKRDVKHLDVHTFQRIKKKLKWYLSHDDPLVFADQLTDFRLGEYRYRVGDYRIIFDLEGDLMTVTRIGHRKEIYR